MKVGKVITVFCSIAFLTACSAHNVDQRRQDAFSIAKKAGFQPFKLKTKLFGVNGYFKKGNNTSEPTIYIEGDGFAWIDKYTISRNPTPRNPLALRLASIDSSDTVFYLPRPCQYVDMLQEKNCSQNYWTNARFSSEVIDSFDQALVLIKNEINANGFHLVGFSGGGAVATLLAEKRNDIKSLRTIAGNLDHVSLNIYKKVSPLSGSLNPMNLAPEIKHIPQIHFTGSDDKVVPSWVAKNFVKATGKGSCASAHSVMNAEHMDGWLIPWKYLHRQKISC